MKDHPMTTSDEARARDMSWIDIAVCRNATVIADCSEGWRDYLDEHFFEDNFDCPVQLPEAVGLYRWSGFTIGSWDEGDSCVATGGVFTPLSFASTSTPEGGIDAAAPTDQRIAEQAALIEAELIHWKGANGGIYMIHAAAIAVARKMLESAPTPSAALIEWVPEATAPKPEPAPVEAGGWVPQIGEKVEVVGEYARDWRNMDLWVAGVRVHDSGRGLNVTLAEQWPIPNCNWRDYIGQTDGFRADDLRPLTAAPKAPNGAGEFKILSELIYRINGYNSAVRFADGYVSGRKVDNARLGRVDLSEYFLKHRDDIKAAITAALATTPSAEGVPPVQTQGEG